MDLRADGKTVLRRQVPGWLGGLITAVLIGSLALTSTIAFAILMFRGEFGVAAAMLALSLWMLSLLIYVSRDFLAKQSWSIELDSGEIRLNLPAGRTLMADAPRVNRLLEVSDISGIETRLESYRSLGISSMQRSYALRLKTGALIVLGEDRALATGLSDETIGRMIDVIILRTGLPLRDRGMVEGKGGFLGVFFTSAPGWEAPGVPPDGQADIWQRASLTLGLAGAAAMTALILSLAF